jgi:hypothetical protein
MMEFTMRLTGIILPFSTYIVGVARSCLHLTVHLRLLDKRKSVWINQITTAQHRRLMAMSAEPTTIAVVGGGMAALIWVQQLREQLADSTHAAQLLVHSPTRPA